MNVLNVLNFLCSLCLLAALWTPPLPAAAQPVSLTQAQGHLAPQGGTPWQGEITLPHLWDTVYPGRDGRATYRFWLPPHLSPSREAQSYGLYFARAGNQLEVRLNGHLLARHGTLDDPTTDASKLPLWVAIPEGLLRSDAASVLEVTASMQASRRGGLTEVQFGIAAEVLPQYETHMLWRQGGAIAVICACLLLGIATGLLWCWQRDPVYLYFTLAAGLTLLRYQDRLWQAPWAVWPLWGGVMALTTGLSVLCVQRMVMAALGRNSPWVHRCFVAAALVVSALALGSFLLHRPLWWTLAIALLQLVSLGVAVVLVLGLRTPQRREAITLGIASLLPVAILLYDYVQHHLINHDAGHSSRTVPLVSLVYIAAMGWVILDRFAHQMRAHQALLQSLDQRVQQREHQLRASYDLLAKKNALQATLQERQRIMRDIHDGVGSQVVGLISLLGKLPPGHTVIKEHAQAVLDELRMAVDAMQPVEGDLGTVLATLRYRLQPRLQAAGLAVHWKVPALPALDDLPPGKVLQIQRLLLEVFTNILRHAGASQVVVSAWADTGADAALVLEITDDGVGFDTAAPPAGGQGLRNLQTRAQALGAQLMLTSAPQQGTSVRLRLPRAPGGAPEEPAP